MRRTIFTEEHEQFRQMVRAFLEKECAPHTAEWLAAGVVSREAWLKAGELGLLGWMVPEEYGGLGITDFRFSVVMPRSRYDSGTQGVGFGAAERHHGALSDRPDQRGAAEALAAGIRRRRNHCAIAMSEPGAGSDLARSSPPPRRDGDHYVINGRRPSSATGSSPTWSLSSRTDPAAGHKGISLLAVEVDFARIQRGRKLDKIGTAPRRHRRTVLPRRAGSGDEPDRRGEPRLLSSDAQPAGRTPWYRHSCGRPGSASGGIDHGVRAGPQGLRSADRHVPGQSSRDRRYDCPSSTSCRFTLTAASPPSTSAN